MDSNNNDSLDVHPMFRYFLHDYLIEKGMYRTASIFMNKTTVPQTPTYPECLDLELDSPYGFLHEWWYIFYETYFPMIEQRSQQFQASSSFNSVMAQQASHLMIPSRLQK